MLIQIVPGAISPSLSFPLFLPPSLPVSLPGTLYADSCPSAFLSIYQSNWSDRVWAETAFHCSYKCSAMFLLTVRMTTWKEKVRTLIPAVIHNAQTPNSHYSACPWITAKKLGEALSYHRFSFQTFFSSCQCGTNFISHWVFSSLLHPAS